MSNRRQFLAASAAAAVTAAALPRSIFAQRRGGEVFSNAALGGYLQGTLTLAAFQQVVGSVFTAFLNDDAVGYFRLLSATTINADPQAKSVSIVSAPGIRLMANAAVNVHISTPVTRGQQLTTFQLVFDTRGAIFGQDSYLLDHGTLGRLTLFLVPGGGSGTCTATFCLL